MKKINKNKGCKNRKLTTLIIDTERISDISVILSVLSVILSLIFNADRILSLLFHLLSFLNL